MKQLKAKVLSNDELLSYPGATYFLMRVHAPEIAAVSKPGQFCMLNCGPDVPLRRPLSIHRVHPRGDVFFLYSVRNPDAPDTSRITIKENGLISTSGKGTTWLSKVAPGSQLNIIGPLGNGFSIDNKSDNLLLAAGGIGIAPLMFLAERAVSLGSGVTLIAGARCKEGLYPDSLLPPGINIIRVVESVENNTRYIRGKVTDVIPLHLAGVKQIFACGPQAMLEAISNQVDNKAVTKPVQASLEVRMGCGLGTCYGCSIKTRQGMQRVCKDGPVFNIKDIIWQEVRI